MDSFVASRRLRRSSSSCISFIDFFAELDLTAFVQTGTGGAGTDGLDPGVASFNGADARVPAWDEGRPHDVV